MAWPIAFGGIMLGFVLEALGVLIPGANFGLNVVFSLLMGVASGRLFAICIVFFQKKTADAYETASPIRLCAESRLSLCRSWPCALWFYSNNHWLMESVIMDHSRVNLFMFGAGLIINAKHSIFAPSDRR